MIKTCHRTACLVFLSAATLLAADKWNMAYLHDEDDSTLLLRGLSFTDERRGVAIGVLNERGTPRGVALVTSDGGAQWTQVRLREEPLAISCVEDICWYTSGRSVWRSDEGGRQWKKVAAVRGMLKLHFTSATQGFGAGIEKTIWSTSDGGKTWTPISETKKITANPKNAMFQAIAFQGPIGIIGGNSRPPRREDSPYPDWMVPDEAAQRREWPGLMMIAETRDGGKTWNSSTTSAFGLVTSIRIRPQGKGALALLEYVDSFQLPSEVLFISFQNGKSASIFRDKTVAVTDVWAEANDRVLYAGCEANALRSLPVPQKVRFAEASIADQSTNTIWTNHDVDYRAVAKRVSLAATPGGKLYAVTDTGMILRLDRAAAN